MKPFIKGSFKRKIFSGDNGYIIGLFKVKDTNDENMIKEVNKTITITGYFHDLMDDENYILYGKSLTHPKYGFQYEVSEYERVKPDDKEGLVQFLSSDLFTGIGERMALRIVEKIGTTVIENIINDYKVLLSVKGMTEEKAKYIFDVLNEYEESHNTIVYLCDLSFSMKEALDIYNLYKKETINIIENNPYKIYYDLNGISFNSIDKIKEKFNIDLYDDSRISAGILYTMKDVLFKTGNTYLEYDELYYSVKNVLSLDDISDEKFENSVEYLVINDLLVFEDGKYYEKRIYDSENNIANVIKYLGNKSVKKEKSTENIEKLEKYFNIEYSDKQKKAISKSINSNVLVITGGPGTGKTTIIKGIVELYRLTNKYEYDELIKNIALLAPTGRAAKRISEQTLLPAYTIHSFLKWNKDTDEFNYNEFNKLPFRFIIVDEVSMIDVYLMDALLKALPKNIKLILVGDVDQLPSVGSGQVLKDIIESDIVETIYLDLLYRQTSGSTIINIAHDIKDGEINTDVETKRDDFSFIQSDSMSILNNIEKICTMARNKGYNNDEIQVLAPMYRGQNGIDNLNLILQKVFNPFSGSKKELKYGDVTYRVGDKVLQLINVPDENIYNGDIGYICDIKSSKESDSKKNEIHINFDGNIVSYTPSEFINFKHGYAISIHKAQGSEFKSVIMPLISDYRRMLTKKIVYTGITRAKENLVILGEYNALNYAIKNEGYERKTMLKERLINGE